MNVLKRNGGLILTVAGMTLILAALSLFFCNRYEDRKAGRMAAALLEDLRAGIEAEGPLDSSDTPEAELPVIEVQGYAYAGILSIPALGLELPVMSEWDYARLKIAPCRQYGSSRTDDLVIAAHNYKTHFGYLSRLETGADIIFTDLSGVENHYTLQKLEILNPDAAETVRNSGYDLVLYTCTPGGAARVTAFCARTVR